MLAVGRGLMSLPRLMLIDEASLGLSPLLAKTVFSIVDRINGDRAPSSSSMQKSACCAMPRRPRDGEGGGSCTQGGDELARRRAPAHIPGRGLVALQLLDSTGAPGRRGCRCGRGEALGLGHSTVAEGKGPCASASRQSGPMERGAPSATRPVILAVAVVARADRAAGIPRWPGGPRPRSARAAGSSRARSRRLFLQTTSHRAEDHEREAQRGRPTQVGDRPCVKSTPAHRSSRGDGEMPRAMQARPSDTEASPGPSHAAMVGE